jgi:DHA2 family multidrug resistance protein
MQSNLLKGGEWWGVFSMAVGFSFFEVVLEECNRKDWFSSPEISQLAVIVAFASSAFLWIELT